jgi:Fic family protein
VVVSYSWIQISSFTYFNATRHLQRYLIICSYIIRTKSDYYSLLQQVREQDIWEDWIMYMLVGIEQTANETIALLKEIKDLKTRKAWNRKLLYQ